MNPVSGYFYDFIGLFFPELCAACGKNLYKNEDIICTNCIYHLPYTMHHKDPENRVARQLWGRFPFKQAGSYVYFKKGNKVQHIMHQLKYNNRPETGTKMGKLYGSELEQSSVWTIPDVVIPVPLHPKKRKLRGYNQSECIAKGMSDALNIPVVLNNLCKATNTETQTLKSRFSRYENLKEAFFVREPLQLENKHLLLVDDVITTGATLEACCLELLKIKNVSISIATIAFAE
ncbi:MAG: ComF family protein [Flavobacterium sp.]|nr:ComF family protein [Pedobacter sp.]